MYSVTEQAVTKHRINTILSYAKVWLTVANVTLVAERLLTDTREWLISCSTVVITTTRMWKCGPMLCSGGKSLESLTFTCKARHTQIELSTRQPVRDNKIRSTSCLWPRDCSRRHRVWFKCLQKNVFICLPGHPSIHHPNLWPRNSQFICQSLSVLFHVSVHLYASFLLFCVSPLHVSPLLLL